MSDQYAQAAQANRYERRPGRAAFWASIAAATAPVEHAADDPERQARPDVGAYSVRPPRGDVR